MVSQTKAVSSTTAVMTSVDQAIAAPTTEVVTTMFVTIKTVTTVDMTTVDLATALAADAEAWAG